MIPAPFDYERADSVEHAVELLGSHEDAKLLAGGHSLLPLMRLRLARPALIVDIDRLSGLEYVRETPDGIEMLEEAVSHEFRYQSMVFCRPASKPTRARKPNSRSARVVSSCRRGCPFGFEESQTMVPLKP